MTQMGANFSQDNNNNLQVRQMAIFSFSQPHSCRASHAQTTDCRQHLPSPIMCHTDDRCCSGCSTKTSRSLDSGSRDPYLIQNLWHTTNGWRRGFSLGGPLSLSGPVWAVLLGMVVLVWLRRHNISQIWEVLLNIETVILQSNWNVFVCFSPPACQGILDWAALRLLRRILSQLLFMLPL